MRCGWCLKEYDEKKMKFYPWADIEMCEKCYNPGGFIRSSRKKTKKEYRFVLK